MQKPNGILAIFQYLDDFTHAIEAVRGRSSEFAGYELYSPTSYHEIEHAAGFGSSPVRFFTLIGGLTGVSFGFALALFTDYDWPVIVGGKTPGIYSLPAYVVIGFECTILLGALATILGMLIHCRIPNPKVDILDNRLMDDRFGIFLPGASSGSEQAKFLKECGAEEIKVIGTV